MTEITPELIDELVPALKAYADCACTEGFAINAACLMLETIADKLRTGQLILAQPSGTCPSCDGTGIDLYDGTQHDCPVCAGRGVATPAQPSGDEVEAVARALLQSRIARKAPGYKHLRSDCGEPFEGDVSDATAAIARLDAVRGKQ